MAAYQCLNCQEVERGEDECCDKPDLFCINDMPAEILRLRTLVAGAAATSGRVGAWPTLTKRMLMAAQDEFHILPPRMRRLWDRMAGLANATPDKELQAEADASGLVVVDCPNCGEIAHSARRKGVLPHKEQRP